MSLAGRKYQPTFFKVKSSNPHAEGAFGEVWDAWHDRLQRVAIKVLRQGVDFTSGDCLGLDDKCKNANFENELKRMQNASDQHCAVPFHGYINYINPNEVLMYRGIVSKFMPCGSLHDVLHEYKISFPKHLAYRILYDISQAMHMLHTLGQDERLLHHDLKPQNVMLDEDLHAKITDFGAATVSSWSIYGPRPLSENVRPEQNSRDVYTVYYSDPEFLCHRTKRTSASDVYSFAIMMWQVLAGRVPFPEFLGRERQFPSAVFDGSRPDLSILEQHHSQNIINIMGNGWLHVRADRPSFRTIRETIKSECNEQEAIKSVVNVRKEILEKQGLQTFAVQESDYNINFATAVTEFPSNRRAQPIMNPADLQPRNPLVRQPDGDVASSQSVLVGDRYLTDAECIRLGNQLHYTAGWEMLARGMSIPGYIIENINLDYPRQAARRKIEIFRVWQQMNGGSNASVKNLIRVLRRERVAVDVWEFLDPDKAIRDAMR